MSQTVLPTNNTELYKWTKLKSTSVKVKKQIETRTFNSGARQTPNSEKMKAKTQNE